MHLTHTYVSDLVLSLISPDGTTVRIAATVKGGGTRVSALLAPVPPIIAAARAQHPDLKIHAISFTFINDEIT